MPQLWYNLCRMVTRRNNKPSVDGQPDDRAAPRRRSGITTAGTVPSAIRRILSILRNVPHPGLGHGLPR